MIDAYDVATIRGLEAEAIAEVGEDTLMQRAASGVAAAVARDVAALRGRVYGTKIMILIGPGNNGGDALFAGARLARRGAAVTGVRCLGRPHARGLTALRDAGGRLIEIDDLDLDQNQWPSKPDVAVDGILGIGGRRGRPAPWSPGWCPLWPSICRPASTPTPDQFPRRLSGPPAQSPSVNRSRAIFWSRLEVAVAKFR